MPRHFAGFSPTFSFERFLCHYSLADITPLFSLMPPIISLIAAACFDAGLRYGIILRRQAAAMLFRCHADAAFALPTPTFLSLHFHAAIFRLFSLFHYFRHIFFAIASSRHYFHSYYAADYFISPFRFFADNFDAAMSFAFFRHAFADGFRYFRR